MRGQTKNISSRVDGEVGSENIANKFASVYSDLYSRDTLGEEFEKLSEKINKLVNDDSIHDVHRVNETIVQKAIQQMKPGKRDAL